ncbi:rCG64469, partial [Rattus norvegicus]
GVTSSLLGKVPNSQSYRV